MVSEYDAGPASGGCPPDRPDQGQVRYTDYWIVGRQALVAQQTRYPDGTYPEGDPPVPVDEEQPWGVGPQDPSVDALLAAWRRVSGQQPGDYADAVVVTTRADLLATTPLHPFTAWKSIYSHPYGQFEARLALLRDVARCTTAACAARLLRDNPYDRVDGVIATRDGDALVLPLAVDNFPDHWRLVELRLPLRTFSRPPFRRVDVGTVTVIALP